VIAAHPIVAAPNSAEVSSRRLAFVWTKGNAAKARKIVARYPHHRVPARGSVKRFVPLVCLAASSGSIAQAPERPANPSVSFEEAIARGAKLDAILHRLRQGDESSFNAIVSPRARIIVKPLEVGSVDQVEPLTVRTLRSWLGSCNQLGEVAVAKTQDPYEVEFVFQCETKGLSGDFRGAFRFEKGQVLEVRIGSIRYGPPVGGAPLQESLPGNDPLYAFLNEHRTRIAKIEVLLGAMGRRDQNAFRAMGGDKIPFSSDPESIFSALMGPGAAHLAIDSFASLRSCKPGRPLSIDGDWYTVVWDCPARSAVEPSRFSFKFAGRNLIAVQAVRQPPKFKLN
jgi:hypothetical protein